ncbi:10891_t:CDS:2, partial [Gigaspora margarita]
MEKFLIRRDEAKAHLQYLHEQFKAESSINSVKKWQNDFNNIEHNIICICEQEVKLNSNYNPSWLERHNNSSKYTSSTTQAITKFIKPLEPDEIIQLPPEKQKICIGLNNQQHLTYLKRVATIVSFGGAPPVYKIAKELFPTKFSNQPFKWAKLSPSENKQLNDQLHEQAKWINDSTANCIRSSKCRMHISITNKKGICDKCSNLKKDKVFQNALRVPIPKSENIKHISKILFKNSPVIKYIKNSYIQELWTIINNSTQDSAQTFWNKLADMEQKGVFKLNSTFGGLCEVMVQVAKCKSKGKGLQNITYSTQFSDFLTVLASTSPQTYHIFQANLAGKSLCTISKSEWYLNDPSICYKNMAHFRKILDNLKYNGPIAASSNNTKVEAKLRYCSHFGAILGSTRALKDTYISILEEIEKLVSDIQEHNQIGKNVRAYVLQIPIPRCLSKYNISQSWPSNDDIQIAVNDAFKEAAALAKFCGMSNSHTLVSYELLLAIFTEPDENSEIQSQSLSNNEAIINRANEICNSPVYKHNELSDNPFLHEEARMQINFLHNSDFQTLNYIEYESIVKYNGKINFEKLVAQKCQHDAYISTKLNKICHKEANSTDIAIQPSLNPGKASELVAKIQKNFNKTHKSTIREFRWKIRDQFEELNERSTDLLNAEIFGYAFALFYNRIHLVQILSMFSKTNSTFHSYIDVPVKAIDSLSYIFVKQIIYYLEKSAILQENSALGLGMVTLQSQ